MVLLASWVLRKQHCVGRKTIWRTEKICQKGGSQLWCVLASLVPSCFSSCSRPVFVLPSFLLLLVVLAAKGRH